MEGLLLVGVGGLAWTASMVMWQGDVPTTMLTSRLIHGIRRHVRTLLAMIGRARLFDALFPRGHGRSPPTSSRRGSRPYRGVSEGRMPARS